MSADAKSALFLAVSLCVTALVFWSYRKRDAPAAERRGISVVSLGRNTAIFGCIFFLFGFYPGSADVPWSYIVGGVAAGGVFGVVVASRATKRWGSELEAQGRLRVRGRSWWQSWQGILLVVLVLLPVGILLPAGFTTSPPGLNGALVGAGNGGCGLFVAAGVHMLAWARRKERELGKPVIIPVSRE